MKDCNKRVTLKNIADRCGYSINTVSRALRNDSSLSSETLEKIQQIANEMGYVRNALASTLRSGKSNMIAIIVEEIQNQHYTALISQMDILLREKGYTVLIVPAQMNDNIQNDEILEKIISLSIDGIILFPYTNSSHLANLLLRNHIPFVLADREIDGVTADTVRCDDYAGGYIIGEEFCRLGHRSFAHIPGPPNNSSQRMRQSGFLDALKDYHIPEKNIRLLHYDNLYDEILNHQVHPATFPSLLFPVNYSALFAFNDQVAYYAINTLKQQNYKVPRDISVIGFDYIRKDISYLMPLTSISYSKECLFAQTAVEYLLSRIENPNLEARKTIFPMMFYERGSTAAPFFADFR